MQEQRTTPPPPNASLNKLTTPPKNASLNKLFDKNSVILMLNLAVSIVTTGL
jgi:hypothetical protein